LAFDTAKAFPTLEKLYSGFGAMSLKFEDLSLSDGSFLPSTTEAEPSLVELSLHGAAADDDDVEMADAPLTSTPTIQRFKPENFQPHISSPLRNVVDEDLLEESDDDVAMDDADKNTSFSKSVSLVFSPTALGAQLATYGSPRLGKVNLTEKLYDIQNESMDSDSSLDGDSSSLQIPSDKVRNRNKQRAPSKLSKFVTNSTDEDATEDEETTLDDSSVLNYQTPMVRTPWGQQPIQFQMHHHHYYPSSANTSYADESQQIVLPAPWSKNASPKAPTPYLISSYLQLIFNALTSSLAIYVLISAIRTIRSDINNKMEEYATEIEMEIQRCTKLYLENRCAPETRRPALEQRCIEWDRCRRRDSRVLANKASVSAETLGIILNALIEPIGVKAIVVVVLILAGWTFTSNFIFGFVRAKSYYGWNAAQGQIQTQQEQQQLQQPVYYNQILPSDGNALSPIKQ
jgi:hypothetical protein